MSICHENSNIGTDRSEQTVQILKQTAPKEQPDQGLHYLSLQLHLKVGTYNGIVETKRFHFQDK